MLRKQLLWIGIIVGLTGFTAGIAQRYNAEREVAPGFYASFKDLPFGWRVWRWETKNGISCNAIKPSVGRPQPYPIGVAGAMSTAASSPWIEYSSYSFRMWSIQARYSGGSVEFRRIGAKFWEEFTYKTSFDDYPETLVEVHATSWEYPEIYVGYSDQRAKIDLRGKSAAMAAVESCAGARRSPEIEPKPREPVEGDPDWMG